MSLHSFRGVYVFDHTALLLFFSTLAISSPHLNLQSSPGRSQQINTTVSIQLSQIKYLTLKLRCLKWNFWLLPIIISISGNGSNRKSMRHIISSFSLIHPIKIHQWVPIRSTSTTYQHTESLLLHLIDFNLVTIFFIWPTATAFYQVSLLSFLALQHAFHTLAKDILKQTNHVTDPLKAVHHTMNKLLTMSYKGVFDLGPSYHSNPTLCHPFHWASLFTLLDFFFFFWRYHAFSTLDHLFPFYWNAILSICTWQRLSPTSGFGLNCTFAGITSGALVPCLYNTLQFIIILYIYIFLLSIIYWFFQI